MKKFMLLAVAVLFAFLMLPSTDAVAQTQIDPDPHPSYSVGYGHITTITETGGFNMDCTGYYTLSANPPGAGVPHNMRIRRAYQWPRDYVHRIYGGGPLNGDIPPFYWDFTPGHWVMDWWSDDGPSPVGSWTLEFNSTPVIY